MIKNLEQQHQQNNVERFNNDNYPQSQQLNEDHISLSNKNNLNSKRFYIKRVKFIMKNKVDPFSRRKLNEVRKQCNVILEKYQLENNEKLLILLKSYRDVPNSLENIKKAIHMLKKLAKAGEKIPPISEKRKKADSDSKQVKSFAFSEPGCSTVKDNTLAKQAPVQNNQKDSKNVENKKLKRRKRKKLKATLKANSVKKNTLCKDALPTEKITEIPEKTRTNNQKAFSLSVSDANLDKNLELSISKLHIKVVQNYLEIAVIDRNIDNGSISKENWKLVENALASNYIQILSENPGPIPAYRKVSWIELEGVKLIRCSDGRAVKLYKKGIDMVGNLWIGAKLEVIDNDDISIRYCAHASIPATPSDTETVMNIIKISNPNLSTENWEITKIGEAKGNCRLITLEINKKSFAALEETKCVISYGFSQITLNVFFAKLRLVSKIRKDTTKEATIITDNQAQDNFSPHSELGKDH